MQPGKFGLDSVYGSSTGVKFKGTGSFINIGNASPWDGVFGTGTGSYASTKLSSWSMWYYSQAPEAVTAGNNADYFAKFRFFSEGINVNGSWYPLIKMEWVNGLTLGEFINKNYNDKNSLLELREKLKNLQRFLSIKKI